MTDISTDTPVLAGELNTVTVSVGSSVDLSSTLQNPNKVVETHTVTQQNGITSLNGPLVGPVSDDSATPLPSVLLNPKVA